MSSRRFGDNILFLVMVAMAQQGVADLCVVHQVIVGD